MTGAWRVLRRGRRWPRSPRSAWLVIRRGDDEVVQFNGPVLDLLTATRVRTDPRLANLGPDLVAPAPFDEAGSCAACARTIPRARSATALLDQHIVAGIGNFWKSEGCWRARVDPWRPIATVTDEEALAVVRAIRPLMQQSAADGRQSVHRTIYGRAGAPCPRCGAPALIQARGPGRRQPHDLLVSRLPALNAGALRLSARRGRRAPSLDLRTLPYAYVLCIGGSCRREPRSPSIWARYARTRAPSSSVCRASPSSRSPRSPAARRRWAGRCWPVGLGRWATHAWRTSSASGTPA